MDVHLAGWFGYPLAVATAILTASAWKNAMGAIKRCAVFDDGAHGQKGHGSPERNPFRAIAGLKEILLGPQYMIMMQYDDALW